MKTKKGRTKNLKILGVFLNKRAQMEIIGLVVIVILITLGMLFLVKFALDNRTIDTLLLRKGLASSTVSSLLKTKVADGECENGLRPQLKEVLEDCARNFPPSSSRSLLVCGNGQHSCDYFREISEQLLDSSLGAWRKKYEFQSFLIRTPGVDPEALIDPPIQTGNGCSNARSRDSSGSFPLPTTDAGLIESVLFICD